MAQGIFITVEGGEGAGKTTQIKLLTQAFESDGFKVLATREPGGVENAEAIRNLLVTGEAERWDAVSEALLFYAARKELVRHQILPALSRGEVVICDRFADSSRVYQGIGKGLGDDFVCQLHRLVLGDFWPKLTLWLDMDARIGLERAAERAGAEMRFEALGQKFHEMVREGFRTLAEKELERICRIGAEQDVAAVHRDIIANVNARLGLALREVVHG